MNRVFFDGREVVVRKNKTNLIRITVLEDRLELSLPAGVEPERILKSNSTWVKAQISALDRAKELAAELEIDEKPAEEYKSKARAECLKIADEYGINVRLTNFRYMKSKWGSWSQKRVLTLNLYLRLLPFRFTEYVAFHELMHYFEPFHTDVFFELIKTKFPDYYDLDIKLMAYWIKLRRENLVYER